MQFKNSVNRNSLVGYSSFFGVFIFLNCIFYRDFSYISLGELVYVTEIFIAFSLVALGIKMAFKVKETDTGVSRILFLSLLFFMWGSLLLIVDNGTSILFKVREYASVYYSLFFIFTISLLSSKRKSDFILSSIIVASFIAALYVVARFLLGKGNITTTDAVYRYGNYEFVGVLVLFCYSLSRFLQKNGNQVLNLSLVALCIFVVNFLITHRSASLGMTISALMIFFYLGRNKASVNKAAIFTLLTIIGLSALILLSPDFGGKAISRITGVFDSSIYEDPNASWRLTVWKHAISHMSIPQFLYGVGWGYNITPLHFLGRDYSVDGFIGIHNSVVFYFLHMGLIGIVLFALLLLNNYYKAVIFIAKSPPGRDKEVVVSLLSANIGVLFFSLFNVLLEGPYMSIVFWTTLGLLYNFTSAQKKDITQTDSGKSYEKNTLSNSTSSANPRRIRSK